MAKIDGTKYSDNNTFNPWNKPLFRKNLEGTKSDDVIYGHEGNDELHGHEGNDKLFGGPGNDTLHGGAGRDVLKGEGGKDRFEFKKIEDSPSREAGSPSSRDTIVDFKKGDRIDIEDIDAFPKIPGNQDFFPSQIQFTQKKDYALLTVSVENGKDVDKLQIVLTGKPDFDITDDIIGMA